MKKEPKANHPVDLSVADLATLVTLRRFSQVSIETDWEWIDVIYRQIMPDKGRMILRWAMQIMATQPAFPLEVLLRARFSDVMNMDVWMPWISRVGAVDFGERSVENLRRLLGLTPPADAEQVFHDLDERIHPAALLSQEQLVACAAALHLVTLARTLHEMMAGASTPDQY